MLQDLSLLQVVSKFILKLVIKKTKNITATEKDTNVDRENTRRLRDINCTMLLEELFSTGILYLRWNIRNLDRTFGWNTCPAWILGWAFGILSKDYQTSLLT